LSPPGAPTPLPEEKIGVLALACPVSVQVQSFDGQPVPVDFELPIVTGGQAPVTLDCTSEPGHGFDIGRTQVSCSASDALQQTASCAFPVTVLAPPRLSATRFLAFGDSLTAGWVSSPSSHARPEPTSAYPYLLQRELRARYLTQTVQIINAGAPGEDARDATDRFRSVVRSQRPEVILLMEGTNDLNPITGGGVDAATRALDDMVVHGRNSGADILLMTIPPSLRPGVEENVSPLNDAIGRIAARRDVLLVDIHDVVRNGSCPGGGTIPCIGADGLHPTADGYRLIAAEMARVIVERYDVEILPADGIGVAAGLTPDAPGSGLPLSYGERQ
jgi:lysophospholipase L1-like esterase